MAPCIFDGNTDMYGLGIRLGFYLQWFSAILARFLVPKSYRDHRIKHPMKPEIAGLRYSNNLFSAATFLALLILIAGNVSSLHVVEIYLVLLLTFGYSLALVPIYLWRIIILCNPLLDPTRWPISRISRMESNLTFLLVTGVASFQLWFWFGRVPQLDNLTCQQYGFLMTKVRLNLLVTQVINILLYFFVLLSCIVMLVASILKERLGSKNTVETGQDITESRPEFFENRRNLLQNLSNVLGLIVEIVVVTATELTIKWNNIQGVYTLSTAGQTIPFAIGVASILRIIYVWHKKRPPPRSHPHIDHSPETPVDRTMFPGRERPNSRTTFPAALYPPPRPAMSRDVPVVARSPSRTSRAGNHS